MAYDFKPFEKKIKDIEAHAQKELGGIRTGRAAPMVLDQIQVESYGSKLSLKEVASISVEDARSLRISPWDSSMGKEIEKAITQANLGLSCALDERGVRVVFPELTAERRAGLLKIAKEKVEDSRAALRVARDDVWSDIQKLEKDGTMPEDDKFRAKDEMQKRVDAANKSFDDALKRKETEIAG